MSNTKNEIIFEEWYDKLKELASTNGRNVSDEAAWREDYDAGSTPEDCFYEEYPEDKPS